MKTANATTFIEICVTCPHCGAHDDKFDELHEHLSNEPRASGINVEVTCSECKENYIVEDINY